MFGRLAGDRAATIRQAAPAALPGAETGAAVPALWMLFAVVVGGGVFFILHFLSCE